MKDNSIIITNEKTLENVFNFIDSLQTKDVVYIKDGSDKNIYGGYYTYTDVYNKFNDDDSFICRIEVDYTKDNKFIGAQILIKED